MNKFVIFIILIISTASAFGLPEETRFQGEIAFEGTRDDASYGPFSIGFDFTFFGATHTQFSMSTNSFIILGTGSHSSGYFSNLPFPTTGLPWPTIAPFWDDTYNYASQNGRMMYQTIGEAPNRKCVMQFTNMGFFARQYVLGTFQVILYEGSNEIQMQYRNIVDTSNPRARGNSATIGLNKGDGVNAAQYSYNTDHSVYSELAIRYTPTGPNSYSIDDTALYEGILLEKDLAVPLPMIPELQNPGPGAIVPGDVIFQWTRPANVVSYTFKIAREDVFNDSTHWSTVYDTIMADPDQTSIRPSDFDEATRIALCHEDGNLHLGGTYYWAVFANNASGDTWSEIQRVTTSDTPPLAATPQTVWAVTNNDSVITLNGTGGAPPYTATVMNVPAEGQLYQYDAGTRGAQITTVPTTVTDPQNRLIYFNPDNAVSGRFILSRWA